ncbi:MAG: response regulator [Candidatus Eiseniibacteriota bacterium]
MPVAEETRKRILWADDEIDLLKPHILYLEGKGCSVTPTTNGEDALSMVQEGPYDVVLLDEMMPGMGGLATLVAIKDKFPTLPVILITKSEQEELMDEALGRRITDYLIKPVNPSQIWLALKKVFESQTLQQDRAAREYVGHVRWLAELDTKRLGPNDWLDVNRRLALWDLELEHLADPGLKQAHTDSRRELNIEFGRFIEDQYPAWLRQPADKRPMLSLDVVERAVAPHLRAGRKVTFIVIDCLRLDQWFALVPLLEPFFDIETEHYYSILPTATPYARNAIFSGLWPDDLGKKHPDYWTEDSKDERSKNRYERQLLDLQLERLKAKPVKPAKYVKIYTAEESQNVRRQVSSYAGLGLVSLVFNFVDIMAHGRSESELLQELAPDETAFRAVLRAWFVHSPLYEIMRSLAQQDGVVVVTTDHGAILGRRAALVYGNRETSTNLRYKYGTNLVCDQKQAINVKNPSDYRLPTGLNKNYLLAREDYYFVYPTRFHEYERQFWGTFQHGGVSLEEMVLPCATLTPRERA